MREEVSAVSKMYNFTLWLLPHIGKFSRDHRFTLGNRIEEGALEALDLLTEASFTKDKLELLKKANIRLERLRFLMRLSKDLRQINLKQYEFAFRAIEEIGSEIGGWIKHVNRSVPVETN